MKEKIRRLSTAGITLAVCSAACCVRALANSFDDGDVPGSWAPVLGGAKDIYSGVLGVFIIIAGVCFILACIMMMLAQNEKTAREARAWAIRIIVILAIAALAPYIFRWIEARDTNNVQNLGV